MTRIHFTPEIYFVPKQSDIAHTLFNPTNGRTASGFYRRNRGGVKFYDAAGKPLIFLVANQHGERFFVSWNLSDNGRPYYQFAMSSNDEAKCGLAGMSHSQQGDLATFIWNFLN